MHTRSMCITVSVILFRCHFHFICLFLPGGKNTLLYLFIKVCLCIYLCTFAYQCPPFFPYQKIFVSFISSTTGVTCLAGATHISGAPQIISFSVMFVLLNRKFLVVLFCRSLIVFCPLSFDNCMSVLRFTASDYHFGIIRLFLFSLHKLNAYGFFGEGWKTTGFSPTEKNASVGRKSFVTSLPKFVCSTPAMMICPQQNIM